MDDLGVARMRELDVSLYTQIRKDMDRTAQAMIDRDKKYHTGSARIPLRYENAQGQLLMREPVKAVMT